MSTEFSFVVNKLNLILCFLRTVCVLFQPKTSVCPYYVFQDHRFFHRFIMYMWTVPSKTIVVKNGLHTLSVGGSNGSSHFSFSPGEKTTVNSRFSPMGLTFISHFLWEELSLFEWLFFKKIGIVEGQRGKFWGCQICSGIIEGRLSHSCTLVPCCAHLTITSRAGPV